MILLNNARAREMTVCSSTATLERNGEMLSTCENVVHFLHHKVSVLRSEAHGGLKFQHIAMRSVSTKKDVLLL